MRINAITLVGTCALALAAGAWDMGEPVTTYWAGPGFPGHPEKLTERAAKQLKEGGFNTVWTRSPEELDVAAKYGLRAIYDMGLVGLDTRDPKQADDLAARIARVKDHPALYFYHHTDEPPAGRFEALARTRDFIARHDPKHPTWVNLLPLYANNRQLGVDGEIIRAYWEHVRRFGEIYRPEFMTYDHYQFNVGGDTPNYLLNLGIIRLNAAALGIPFFNGVQACTWRPGSLASPHAPRIPGPDELRYLVYTTIAYGAQGIYYYVYSHPGHAGAIAELDGTTGAKYEEVKRLNRDFIALVKELRPFRFTGAYLQGRQAPGTTPYSEAALLRINPATPPSLLMPGQDFADTTLVTRFDAPDAATRLMVVNMDYRKDRTFDVTAPTPLEHFNPQTGAWTAVGNCTIHLTLTRGSGVLLRLTK